MEISTTMKKIILLIGILVSVTAAHVVFGQVTEGIISYEDKVNVHRTLPEDRQEMKDMIPEFRTSQQHLAFNADESLYKPLEEDVADEDIEGPGMRMRFRRSQSEFYVNQAESRRAVLQEFMGKKYLIEDSLRIIPWKFSNDVREIKGYQCKKATYYNEERKQNITAWYTDKLRPFLGPESFTTLPGAVLMIDINDGERMVTATKIEGRPVKKNELRLTPGGTKITEAEFRKTREEQIEKMKANGGNIIIRN
jgi:GLPGLI family protein